MAQPEEIVANEIKNYIDNNGLPYNGWYVGITDDTQKRLFIDHKVGQYNWIYRECFNSDAARRVEDYFVRLGTKGDSGGGDEKSKYIYAYKITNSTVE